MPSRIIYGQKAYISLMVCSHPGKMTGHDHSEPGSNIEHVLAISVGHEAALGGSCLNNLTSGMREVEGIPCASTSEWPTTESRRLCHACVMTRACGNSTLETCWPTA